MSTETVFMKDNILVKVMRDTVKPGESWEQSLV